MNYELTEEARDCAVLYGTVKWLRLRRIGGSQLAANVKAKTSLQQVFTHVTESHRVFLCILLTLIYICPYALKSFFIKLTWLATLTE